VATALLTSRVVLHGDECFCHCLYALTQSLASPTCNDDDIRCGLDAKGLEVNRQVLEASSRLQQSQYSIEYGLHTAGTVCIQNNARSCPSYCAWFCCACACSCRWLCAQPVRHCQLPQQQWDLL